MKQSIENQRRTTADPAEIARFAKDSADWWNEKGPFAPLHRLNPARLGYIKSVLCNHYARDVRGLSSLSGLKILDVGCGGGLVCEPMARLGADVTGIDGDKTAIETASTHSKNAGLSIAYANTTTDALQKTARERFDVVLALEIIEHVTDPRAFIEQCCFLAKPGGVIIVSTLNKNIKSLVMGKIAAEYILRWVPAGTHDWRKFIRPSQLSEILRSAGAKPVDIKGLIFNPMKNNFEISATDMKVNYLISAIKEKKA